MLLRALLNSKVCVTGWTAELYTQFWKPDFTKHCPVWQELVRESPIPFLNLACVVVCLSSVQLFIRFVTSAEGKEIFTLIHAVASKVHTSKGTMSNKFAFRRFLFWGTQGCPKYKPLASWKGTTPTINKYRLWNRLSWISVYDSGLHFLYSKPITTPNQTLQGLPHSHIKKYMEHNCPNYENLCNKNSAVDSPYILKEQNSED